MEDEIWSPLLLGRDATWTARDAKVIKISVETVTLVIDYHLWLGREPGGTSDKEDGI